MHPDSEMVRVRILRSFRDRRAGDVALVHHTTAGIWFGEGIAEPTPDLPADPPKARTRRARPITPETAGRGNHG